MKIAFYAPMKWPGHAVPSGDRLIARMFLAALEQAGHTTTVASRLRSWEAAGDAARQARLAAVGARVAQRLVRRYRDRPDLAPDLWFTYHLYHKAPDWLGPVVSAGLSIPYVIAEASVARKQRDGRWRIGYEAAQAAIGHADAVVCVNPGDMAGVSAVRAGRSPPVYLAPFCDVETFVRDGAAAPAQAALRALDLPSGSPRMATVAMMRHGDKLASYRTLAAALAHLLDLPWHLVVVGDGDARAQVHHAFAAFGPERVRFVGVQPPPVVAALLQQSGLFAWPAIGEAIGMALLEAQACGVPVVAGRSPGVEAIVDDTETGLLVPLGSETAFAAALRSLLADPARRMALGQRARSQAIARHGMAVAVGALAKLLGGLRAPRAGQAP